MFWIELPFSLPCLALKDESISKHLSRGGDRTIVHLYTRYSNSKQDTVQDHVDGKQRVLPFFCNGLASKVPGGGGRGGGLLPFFFLRDRYSSFSLQLTFNEFFP